MRDWYNEPPTKQELEDLQWQWVRDDAGAWRPAHPAAHLIDTMQKMPDKGVT